MEPEEKPEYLTEEEVADLLRISGHKLYVMRRAGKGPEHIRLGHRTIRYSRAEVDRFMESMSNAGGTDE